MSRPCERNYSCGITSWQMKRFFSHYQPAGMQMSSNATRHDLVRTVPGTLLKSEAWQTPQRGEFRLKQSRPKQTFEDPLLSPSYSSHSTH
eukprot:4716257-Pleurochrysis_carterae.AAC.1